jgi:uncharacterized protein (UPF0371 family)
MEMMEADIKQIVQAVLDEEADRHSRNMDDAVLKAVATILTSFGIEDEDRRELRADFIHLRKWRKSVEQTQGLAFKVIVGAIISGIVGAFWMGFKAALGK